MYLKFVIIALLYFTKVSISAPIDTEESGETQLLDYYQSRGDEAFEFKYELSDGQMREEKITYDDLDNGISIKGSYMLELEGGKVQTIYYISDTRGHRISIDVPFSDDEVVKRPPPTRKPQDHSESKKRYHLAVDEYKSYQENRVEDGQRKGRIQANRKNETVKDETKTKDVSKPVEEVVKKVKTDVEVKVEDKVKTEKLVEQVNEEEKSENDDHTEESAKQDDNDEQ